MKLTASGNGVDLEKARPALAVRLERTSEQSGAQADAVTPRQRVQTDVSGAKRVIEIVPPLRVLVHIGAEDLQSKRRTWIICRQYLGNRGNPKTMHRIAMDS